MPPKVKITKEMIVDAAFDIIRSEGAEKITARRISEVLNCSTQPVLYHFATVDEIKEAVYAKVDKYQSSYLMDMTNDYDNPMLVIGLNYIRFAVEESQMFRFLFQSNEFKGASLLQLTETDILAPMLEILQQETNMSAAQAKEIFTTLLVFVHGYASFFANNDMIYKEEELILQLTKVFDGAICIAKEKKDEETI